MWVIPFEKINTAMRLVVKGWALLVPNDKMVTLFRRIGDNRITYEELTSRLRLKRQQNCLLKANKVEFLCLIVIYGDKVKSHSNPTTSRKKF